jgi:transposase
MRGQQERTGPLFSYISTEDRIPKAHPLRQVRRLADQALDRLNPTFCRLYPEGGRPSIPPEQLLLALLLQGIYGIRSERMLMEQLDDNLLFRWFIGLKPDDPVWHPTTFTKNRDRLLNEELMARFLELLMASPELRPLLSSEHCSVDGTLLRAWVSHGSLERMDGSDDEPPPPSGGNDFEVASAKSRKRAKGDFRGLLLSNQTHRSSSDGEARLFRKSGGTGAYLSDLGHCLMENRPGLVVASEVTPADGYGERAAAVRMARSLPGAHQKTLGADKGYDTRDFVADSAVPESRRMWPRTLDPVAAPPSTAAPPAIGATPSRSMPASGSSRDLVGSNRPQGSGSSRPEAVHGCERYSGCMWWPTT